MRRAFVDADILIWHLRRKREAEAFLELLVHSPETLPCISAMQSMEVLFQARAEEMEDTLQLLHQFEIVPVTSEVVESGATLYRRWRPSHGTDPNDAILAATVIQAGGKLYTQNIRHFPMPELDAELGWE